MENELKNLKRVYEDKEVCSECGTALELYGDGHWLCVNEKCNVFTWRKL